MQLKDRSEDGGPQIVFYTSGISSQADSWNPYNLLTGNSIWSQIIDQYINICSNYDFADGAEQDKIYLFGFSRGAMAVRALASLIAEFGLLHPRDVRHLPRVLEAWSASSGSAGLPTAIRLHKAKVEFVGLFDSVMGGVEWLSFFNPVRFRNHKLPARCRTAVQILAIDENRRFFKPKFWDGIAKREADPEFEATRMLKQIWMPGVHSDIGGTGKPVWGQAALLAMIFFIDRYTRLSISTEQIERMEQTIRQAIEDETFIIDPHRSVGSGFKRRPSGSTTSFETGHPICAPLERVTYARRTNYPWRDLVYGKRFKGLPFDPQLEEYFAGILQKQADVAEGRGC